MSQPDAIRLRHMLDAAREALEFTHGKQRADLDRERMLVLAVVRCIEVMERPPMSVPRPGPAILSCHGRTLWLCGTA
jgi:hypothetical protein